MRSCCAKSQTTHNQTNKWTSSRLIQSRAPQPIGLPPRFDRASRDRYGVSFLRPWIVGECGLLNPTLPPRTYNPIPSSVVTPLRTSSTISPFIVINDSNNETVTHPPLPPSFTIRTSKPWYPISLSQHQEFQSLAFLLDLCTYTVVYFG